MNLGGIYPRDDEFLYVVKMIMIIVLLCFTSFIDLNIAVLCYYFTKDKSEERLIVSLDFYPFQTKFFKVQSSLSLSPSLSPSLSLPLFQSNVCQ